MVRGLPGYGSANPMISILNFSKSHRFDDLDSWMPGDLKTLKIQK